MWPFLPCADAWLKGDYDEKKQAELCHKIAVALGFDLEHGRLDVSVHPFTGGVLGWPARLPGCLQTLRIMTSWYLSKWSGAEVAAP